MIRVVGGVRHLSTANFTVRVSDAITLAYNNALVSTHFRVTCNKKTIDKVLCCSTASYFKMVNGKCVDKENLRLLISSQNVKYEERNCRGRQERDLPFSLH